MDSTYPEALRTGGSLAQLFFQDRQSPRGKDAEHKTCTDCEKKLPHHYFAPIEPWIGEHFEESLACVDCQIRDEVIRVVAVLRKNNPTAALTEEEKSDIILSQRASLRTWSGCLFKNICKFVSHSDLGASLARAEQFVEEVSVAQQASNKTSSPRTARTLRTVGSAEKTGDTLHKSSSYSAFQPPQRSAAKRARSAIRRSAGNCVVEDKAKERNQPPVDQQGTTIAIGKDRSQKVPRHNKTAPKENTVQENTEQTPEKLVRQIAAEQAHLRRKALRHLHSAQSTFELIRRENLNQRNPLAKDLWSKINSVSGDQELAKNILVKMETSAQEGTAQLQSLKFMNGKEKS